MNKTIEVLETINRNKQVTQRDIAEAVGISVGKVNSIIKGLLQCGHLEIEKINRNHNYIITSVGLEFLEDNLKRIQEKKLTLHTEVKKKVTQAVILAAGERKEFGKPIGTLKLEDKLIAERTVDLLRENGIEKIVVVTGYEAEYYEELAQSKKLELVKNNKYKWTGTMYSLALAHKFIEDDFILVENDLIFEERAITEVLKNENRDCMLITSESGSGDEAFVEIKNDFIFKMSKDKHQFNRIDGEMIGIVKVSYEVYKRMLKDFEYNVNPYLNYEYSLMDVGRNYNIGYVKLDDLVWAEIDNEEHYHNVVNYIYPRLRRKEMEFKAQSLRSFVCNALNLKEEEVGEITAAGGMTNKNYKVEIQNKPYILRVPGLGTEDMINRKEEKLNAQIGYELGIDTRVLFFDDNTGIKISRFIDNAETLNGVTAKKEENMRLTSGILKKLHSSGVEFKNRFDVFEKIEHYEKLLKEAKGNNFKDYYEVKERVMALKDLLDNLDVKILSCHNDAVPENFIKSGEDRIYLIDWEYSGMNDPMWDLAAHAIECNFSENDEELFLNLYFGKNPEEKFKTRILIHKICQDFLWSIWTNIKEAKGDNFGTYGIDRYNRAKKNLEILEKGV